MVVNATIIPMVHHDFYYCNGYYGKECTNCHQAMVFSTFFTIIAITVMNSHGAPWVLLLYSLP